MVFVFILNVFSFFLFFLLDCSLMCLLLDLVLSFVVSKFNDVFFNFMLEKKEYLVDLFFFDIKNSIYLIDEFRMFLFKVRFCLSVYFYDWIECFFVYFGENVRSSDLSKYYYSCVFCFEFRKGVCSRGDMCEYAYGVFECWLYFV